MTASLRDRLREKRRRSTTYPLAVEDTSETDAAVAEADTAYRLALFRHQDEDHEDVVEAKRVLDEAQETQAGCYEYVTIRALSADDFEALVDAHPPKKGQDSDNASWHEETFRPALLAACVESDMTEDDWREFAKSASTGEQIGLYNAALEVNTRTPAPAVPKGSTLIRS